MQPTLKLPTIIICLALVPLINITSDITAASLPALTTAFAATPREIRSAVSLFYIGLAIGELPMGTVSDYVGRKPLLIGSLCLLRVSSLLPLCTHSVAILYVSRFIQGLACAGPGVLIRVIITDAYTSTQRIKHLAKIPFCAGMGTLCFTLLGAHLAEYCGWQASWLALSLIAIMMTLLAVYTLSPTTKTRQLFQVQPTLAAYWKILQSPLFIRCTYLHGFSGVQATLFLLLGPFLIQSSLGYSAVTFGHCAVVINCAYMAGCICYATTLYLYPFQKIQIILLTLMSLTTLWFLWQSYTHTMTLISLIIPVALLIFYSGIQSAACSANVMLCFPDNAGTVSASTVV